jgi:SAM-dependent methyltransferase
MMRAAYDAIAARFDASRTALRPAETKYLSLLLDSLPGCGTILDLGCGTGHPIATHIASLGYQVVGVDSSQAMLAIARARLPQHRWIHGLIEHVEFEETFAAVVCWDSLFHLPRHLHQPVIRKIHRWLAPGGRLMVSTGGLVGDHGFTDTMFGHEFFYDSLSPGQLAAIMEEIGFEILMAEMCDPPDGGRNKGKWATVASAAKVR